MRPTGRWRCVREDGGDERMKREAMGALHLK